MEYDAIDGVRLPPQLAVGERLLITGLGSYDRTIAFDFGHGDGVPSV